MVARRHLSLALIRRTADLCASSNVEPQVLQISDRVREYSALRAVSCFDGISACCCSGLPVARDCRERGFRQDQRPVVCTPRLGGTSSAADWDSARCRALSGWRSSKLIGPLAMVTALHWLGDGDADARVVGWATGSDAPAASWQHCQPVEPANVEHASHSRRRR